MRDPSISLSRTVTVEGGGAQPGLHELKFVVVMNGDHPSPLVGWIQLRSIVIPPADRSRVRSNLTPVTVVPAGIG